jgi:hypothetical protein
MHFPKGPDPAAARRKTMPASTAFRRVAELSIARSVYLCAAALAMFILFGSQNPASAAEIRLLWAASIQEVFKEIIGDFERTSGHKMIIQYSSGPRRPTARDGGPGPERKWSRFYFLIGNIVV